MKAGDRVEDAPRFIVLNMSCPMSVMQFYLVYQGELVATGNKPRPGDVCKLRDALHPQLAYLWQNHIALQRLRNSAQVPAELGHHFADLDNPPDYESGPRPLPQGWIDLCEPIRKDGSTYIPLVRKSLALMCHLDILFLRQEKPGELVLQGGELDNRIKTLFDALRIPNAEVARKHPQMQDPTYCLLEEDTLISGFEVSTGQLLFPQTQKPNEVHLVIEVEIRVLRLGSWNICLLSD